MKIIYFCSTGSADAVRASIPFHLGANGSLANGDEVGFILGGDASELILGDHVEKLTGLGLPPLRELITKVKENALAVYV